MLKLRLLSQELQRGLEESLEASHLERDESEVPEQAETVLSGQLTLDEFARCWEPVALWGSLELSERQELPLPASPGLKASFGRFGAGLAEVVLGLTPSLR